MIKNNNAILIGCDDVTFGDRVEISGWKGQQLTLIIGKGVRIENDVRIIAGGTVTLSDEVTLHNHVAILGPGDCYIGPRTWVAQHTLLDATGDLEIGADCCIEYNCLIWSHVSRVPKIPEHSFYTIKKTIIKDKVWLMGGLITINPGVTLGEGCIIFANSVVTKDTLPYKVYGGIPIKLVEKYDK